MDDLRALSAAARDADGVAPLNEVTQISLRSTDSPTVHERVLEDGALVGVALGFGDSPVELVVHPEHRRHGLGRALWERAVAAGATRFWAHGDLPGARALAAAVDAAPTRTLLVLRLTSNDAQAQERDVPGVSIRTFADADADAVVAVNAAAFATHPEQGAMDRADFDRRREEPWFDPAGLFVAERDGTVIGFHWTKIEDAPDGRRTGEVYVVGVEPSAHGGGLGTALTARGVRHLWESGVDVIDLYVEGDNTAALAVYHRLGFVEHARDVLYSR